MVSNPAVRSGKCSPGSKLKGLTPQIVSSGNLPQRRPSSLYCNATEPFGDNSAYLSEFTDKHIQFWGG